MKLNASDVDNVNGISLLRVIAVMMVLLVHFTQSIPLPDKIHTFVLFGQNGVELFFLISGYLIFKSLDKNSSPSVFYKKRIIRIVPIYYAVLIINIIAFQIILKEMPVDDLHLGWLRYFLFLNTLLPSKNVDVWNNLSALWTMSGFWFFYILAPLFHKLMKKFTTAASITSLVYIIGKIYEQILYELRVDENILESIYYISIKSPVATMWIFLVGATAYRCVNSGLKEQCLVCFSVIGLLGVIFGNSEITMVMLFAIILLFIGNSVYSLKWGKLIKCIDEYSFAIYLGHTTAIEIVTSLDIIGSNNVVKGILSLILTIPLVLFLHNFIEKPFFNKFQDMQNSWISPSRRSV